VLPPQVRNAYAPGDVTGARLDMTRGFEIVVTTGKVETLPIDASSFAFGGGTLFYGRTDTPEIRRVRDGDAWLRRAKQQSRRRRSRNGHRGPGW